MSADVTDVVNGAGGLIVDRVRLGWQVVTHVDPAHDPHPLHILGAEVADLTDPAGDRDLRTALVVSAALYVADRAIRAEVDRALAAKDVEVLLWGQGLPAELDRDGKTASYRFSRAAAAFKEHAMRAAGLPTGTATDVEVFRTRCGPGLIARDFDIAG